MFSKLAVLALATTCLANQAGQDQAYLAILVETQVGRMAGMPPIDLSEMPPGFKLPPQAMMFSGQAVRSLNVRLWSPGIAAPDAKATLAVPSGLKKGPKLDLELFRPKGETSGPGGRDFDPDANPDQFTIKFYWGSSETVREGQPKVFKWSDMDLEVKEAMKNRARVMDMQSSYFYKPNWTTGYWPTNKQPGQIDKSAALPGTYSLESFAGNVSIDAPSNVDFLAPIAMSAPNLDDKVNLTKAIRFKWEKVPNALGLNAAIIGMEGKNTLVMWSSSEVFAQGIMGQMDYLQMAQVRDYVEKTMFMAGDRTEVTVPIGIFKDADFAMMNMAGFGPGAALETGQPLPRIQTKTTLMLMLGGKKVDF